MKKYNVYVEPIYFIVALCMAFGMILFFVLFFLMNFFPVYFMAALAFLIVGILFLILGLPGAINYFNCKKEEATGRATIIDKFQKNSKSSKAKYLIVLEYKVNKMAFRSVNLVDKELADTLLVKSKVDVRLHEDKALIIK